MKFLLILSLLLFVTIIVLADDDMNESSNDNDKDKKDTTNDNDDETPTILEDNGVLVLTDDNFDEALEKYNIIMVEFYAPWCGHCKSLAPHYEAAAKRLKAHSPPVPLAKVDATVHTKLGERYQISGYPTIKIFRKGDANPIDYDGARDEEGIVVYMREKADPNWKPPPEAVITLTKENFTTWTNKEELMLVEFYAPWCGHCKKFAPEYEKAAQALKNFDPPIPLAKVDATVEDEMAKSFQVSGYPTLKIFRKNKVFEYNGPREGPGLIDYMKQQIGDASKEQKTFKDIKNLMNIDDVTIIGFFDDSSSKMFENYQEAANHLRDGYTFGHSFDKNVRDNYKVNANSIVVFNAERFYTKFEPKWHIFSKSDATVDEIKNFFKSKERPLVGEYNVAKNRYPETARPLVLFFYTVDFSFDGRKNTQIWRKKVAEIAKDYNDLIFAIADEEKNDQLFKEFGFDDSGEEINIGILDAGNVRYPMPVMDEFDNDEIRSFIKSYKAGKLKPKIKSQPIPKKQPTHVKVVVGKNFNDIVMDSKRDVLIEMYAPWCGHCKAFEPEYKKFAKQFKGEKNLVMAKMDATANETPISAYKAEGFPTIYFAPSNNKLSPIKYAGNRDLKDLEEFIKKHATVAFKDGKDEL